MPDSPPSNNQFDDDDSLFGSPPPSPSRGRSPSPLAFPSGTAQNVGTLALPGSHLVAELPVTPPASSSLSASASAPSYQLTSHPPPPRLPLQSIGVYSRRSSSGPGHILRTEGPTRKPRKRKERENSGTPRPTPPSIPLPSPDEPPPLNFLRNQQALLGVAGMVGGVNPATLAKTHQTRGTTAENPIVVEDEPTLFQQPSIGKRPTRPGPSNASHLSRPTSEQILGTLLEQKNIFPVVVSLLRLLVPNAPSLASVSPHYPVYSYPYAATTGFRRPYACTSSTSPSSPQSRSQSPEHAPHSRQSPSFSAPPLKRRRLNSVPAGAGDWDVPYPFQEGHGPDNYRSNWERERGKRLLADLVQLVQGAAQKAATKAWYQQQAQQRMFLQAAGGGGHGSWHWQPGMMKYYRPATFSYGLERPNAQYHGSQMQSQTRIAQSPGSPPSVAASTATTSPEAILAPSCLGYAQLVAQAVTQTNANTSAPISDFSSMAFDQLVESLLSAQQQRPLSSSDSITDSTTDPGIDLDSSSQALFDNWLEILTAFPPGDPNDASASGGAVGSPTPAASTPATTTDGGPFSLSMQDRDTFSTIPDAMIDPTLLDLAASALMGTAFRPESSSTSTQPSSHPNLSTRAIESSSTTPSPTSTATSRQPPMHTPSLVGSPSVTATSLNDPGDAGPATPSWDWTIANLGDEEGTKPLDEWAGMDLDVAMASWGVGDGIPAVSIPVPVPEAAPPAIGDSSASPQPEGDTARQVVEQDKGAPDFGSLPEPTTTETVQPAEGAETGPCLAGDAGHPASNSDLAVGPSSCPPPPPPGSTFSFAPPQQSPPYPPFLPPPSAQESLRPAPVNPSACAKGKARAIPGTGNGIGVGSSLGKQDRRAVVERARAMRAVLVAEIERAKVALWETTLEQGVLVGLGRELEKGKEKRSG